MNSDYLHNIAFNYSKEADLDKIQVKWNGNMVVNLKMKTRIFAFSCANLYFRKLIK